MRTERYRLDEATRVEQLPVDWMADPDGPWTFEALVEAAGFGPETDGVLIGALTEAFDGHPDGSAVVCRDGASYLAVIECIAEPIRLQLRQPAPLEAARAA